VKEVAALCELKSIHWVDGSQENRRLPGTAKKALYSLNPEKANSFAALATQRCRVEDKTFIAAAVKKMPALLITGWNQGNEKGEQAPGRIYERKNDVSSLLHGAAGFSLFKIWCGDYRFGIRGDKHAYYDKNGRKRITLYS
jgi:hypothetical protein